MTRQEVDRMLAALELIAGRLNDLNEHVAEIAGKLDEICECIGTTSHGGRYFRIIDWVSE